MILIVIFLQTHTLTSLAFALWLFHNRGHFIKVAVSIYMKQNRTNFHVNSMMLANRTPNRMLNEHHPPTKKPHNLRWRRRRRRARRSNSMMCARVSMRRRNKATAELKLLWQRSSLNTALGCDHHQPNITNPLQTLNEGHKLVRPGGVETSPSLRSFSDTALYLIHIIIYMPTESRWHLGKPHWN